MAEEGNILTYAGLERYKDELQSLRVVKWKEIARRIKETRKQGDLSENAEYGTARDKQRDIKFRIEELEKLLRDAEIAVKDGIDLDKINVGCKVRVYETGFDGEMEFKIAGSTGASSLQNKISNESPVGQALIDKKVRDVADVETQVGMIQYKVLEIQRVP